MDLSTMSMSSYYDVPKVTLRLIKCSESSFGLKSAVNHDLSKTDDVLLTQHDLGLHRHEEGIRLRYAWICSAAPTFPTPVISLINLFLPSLSQLWC